DLLNQTTSETDVNGDSIRYEYYPNGNIQKEIYQDGTYTLYTYNKSWKVISVTDGKGSTTSYSYDAMGNVTKEVDAEGNTKEYTYDRYGRLTDETDANGNTTTYEYDRNSNCTAVTTPDGVTTKLTYDALNHLITAGITTTNGQEYKVSYEYDALGRVTAQTDEEGNTTRITYDENSNVVAVTDALGKVTATYTYDEMGRKKTATNAVGYKTDYEYDTVGNLIKTVTYLNGAYAGNEVASTNATNETATVTTYAYDELSRLISVTDPQEGTTKATYDKAGNLTSVVDANGGTTAYTYDSMRRILTEINAIGSKTSYSYNAKGLLSEVENANGQKTTYTYDALGRITAMIDETGTTTYTYDGNSNVLTVTDEKGTISRSYDCMNRVTKVTDYKGNTIEYSYDEIGNLIAITYPGGEKVRYSYYKNGYLKKVIDTAGNVTTYEYDGNGNLTRTVRPNGTEEICTYNEAGYITSQRDEKDGEVINEYIYTYDEKGNITQVIGTGTTGTSEGISRLTSAEMTYDADNRMKTYNGENVLYDAEGNMTYGPINGEMTTLEYDCRNRLIKAGNITYEYDSENNRIAMETDSYREEYVVDTVSSSLSRVLVTKVYDKKAETEETEKGETRTGTATINGTASILRNSVNSIDVSLVSDETETQGANSEVSILNRSLGIVLLNSFDEYISTNGIDEVIATNKTTTGNTIEDSVYSLKETITYIYGNGLISEYKNNVVLYHHYNNIGSTTALTDAGGNIIATYTYGAYGELLSGDNVITKYLYNGRAGVSTEDNGLYYMRQRYYNPEIKRFINRDVVTGTLGNSQSLNRYSYVQGNPISLTDPFGLSPINGLFSGGSFNLGGLLLAGIHTALDVAGSGVGIISTVANAVNAVLYAAVDKDYAMAALSAVSAISLGAGNIAKLVGKGSFGAATIRVTGNIISGMTNFGVNASMAVDMANQMLDKYVWGDQEFGEEGKAEVLFLALSIYGGLNSVAVAMHNAKQLGNMMKCVDEQSKELEYLIKQLSNSQVKASEGSSAVDMARASQGNDVYTGIDNWTPEKLYKGDVYYRGEPNGTEFFTTKKAIDSVGSSKNKLFQGLQVKEDLVYGYRKEMVGYMLNTDLDAAQSICLQNMQFGAGGLEQKYIPYANKLIQDEILVRVDKIILK
ncbi:MAG: hypothetical protein K2M73_02465, partial [Lachnospiraceae bacterium]|nr:hypothetical protein [Lachnospiraceae bacterium]